MVTLEWDIGFLFGNAELSYDGSRPEIDCMGEQDIMPTATLNPMGVITIQLGDLIETGVGPKGARIIVDVLSAKVESDRLNATLATNDAADWLTLSEEGTLGVLDVRLTLRTDDGAFIYVEYGGRVDMATGLIAAAPTFQTGDDRYKWLNRVQAVLAGQVNLETGVLIYNIYEVQVAAD